MKSVKYILLYRGAYIKRMNEVVVKVFPMRHVTFDIYDDLCVSCEFGQEWQFVERTIWSWYLE